MSNSIIFSTSVLAFCKGCTKECVIIRLCISVLGKAQEDSQTANQDIKQQEFKSSKGLEELFEGCHT